MIDIVLQHPNPVNREGSTFRAWVESLSERAYAQSFGVSEGSKLFICPTTGQTYIDPLPLVQNDAVWTRCRCCDAALRVRGSDADYDSGNPQRHCYPIVEGL